MRLLGLGLLLLNINVALASMNTPRPILGRAAQLLRSQGAQLTLSADEVHQIIGSAQEMIDPVTGRAFKSVRGNALNHWVVPARQKGATQTLLALTTIHGDELSAAYWGMRFLKSVLIENLWRPQHTQVIWVPIANPDGLFFKKNGRPLPRRVNARGIDLNRNFNSTAPEAETRWLQTLIQYYQPRYVISVHSPFGWLDYDGPGLLEADSWLERIHQATHLPRRDSFEAYPGSLGDYAGVQGGAHVLTWELPKDTAVAGQAAWKRMHDALWEALDP